MENDVWVTTRAAWAARGWVTSETELAEALGTLAEWFQARDRLGGDVSPGDVVAQMQSMSRQIACLLDQLDLSAAADEWQGPVLRAFGPLRDVAEEEGQEEEAWYRF